VALSETASSTTARPVGPLIVRFERDRVAELVAAMRAVVTALVAIRASQSPPLSCQTNKKTPHGRGVFLGGRSSAPVFL
jgi:hypothetical protein